jgi:manganese transport protein
MGVNAMQALIFSQVVLSFGIPLVLIPLVVLLIPLVVLTARKLVMNTFANRLPTIVLSVALTIIISGLNLFVLVQAL